MSAVGIVLLVFMSRRLWMALIAFGFSALWLWVVLIFDAVPLYPLILLASVIVAAVGFLAINRRDKRHKSYALNY